jgi:hypothetical protein
LRSRAIGTFVVSVTSRNGSKNVASMPMGTRTRLASAVRRTDGAVSRLRATTSTAMPSNGTSTITSQ